ncbi:prolyl oligopeptidase family serine peptidase [candidate division KSB1 bacterium]
MRITKNSFLFVTVLAFLLFSNVLFAQESGIKVLDIEDYMRWRSITSTSISDDGNWITFGYGTPRDDDTLYVKQLSSDKIYEIPRASRPEFSDDARWVAYQVTLPFKETEKLRRDNETISLKAELLDLVSGEKFTVDNMASFTFSKDSKFFAVKKTKTNKDAAHKGTDLLLRNLTTGFNELIGSVAEFSFNKPGTLLAYVVDAADTAGNGLYAVDLDAGIRIPLDTDKAIYERMAWEEEGRALAVLRGIKEKGLSHRSNTLLAFAGIANGDRTKIVFDPAQNPSFPDSTVISEKGSLTWSEDLTKVFFGIKDQEKEPDKKKDDEPVANVDVFHWNDDRLQTVQIRQAERDRNFTYTSVYDLKSKRFVRLADKEMKNIILSRDGNFGVGSDNRAYISDWKPSYADYYCVNTTTGERTLIIRTLERTFGISPDSKHFLYWKDGRVWDYNLDKGQSVNLTQDAPVSFINVEYDRFGEKPAFGVSGWTQDKKSVILRGLYDLWLQPLDGGKAQVLTEGTGSREEIRFRYIRLDPEERFIDLSKPVLLSAFGKWTKKSGFYELHEGKVKQLIFDDKRFGNPDKAKNADKFMYTVSTFAEFPDYHVSDNTFSRAQQVTDANPWQSDYRWGHRILFDYTNNSGVRLQGTLAIPDDYVRGQKLPMLVNFYEKYSQSLHNYYPPRYSSSSSGHFSSFVSKGYLLMQPDVHFNLRTSHSDMLECVEAAVKKVIEMGYADPERIGLHGHSYSGGGSAFISTRSKMFAAIASGAAPINLAGEFNILFSGSGQNNHRYDIYGQGRYATNPFDDFELYRSQSPITFVKTMDTPLLYLHGADDPTVEYLQGMEFYNALRFLGKPVIFLSYPGEAHGLRRFENQKDFSIRFHQFFDHHLRGKEAPDWMVNGVPFLKKNK